MAIEVIKPFWVKQIDAYVVKIGGKSYIIDLDVKPEMLKPSKSDNTESMTDEKTLSEEELLIQSGASFQIVNEKFPEYKKASYYQTRKRMGLTKKRRKRAKATESAEMTTTRATRRSSKAAKSDSKSENHPTEHTSSPA